MARVEKFTRAAVGNLLAHFERRQKVNPATGEMEYVRFGNRDIDTRWSELNYRTWPPLDEEDYDVRGVAYDPELWDTWDALGDPEETSLQRWQRIYRETPHSNRKDLACFCCWAMALPDEIPLERSDQFFNLVTRYCINEYGAENIVGAWVHWDEAGRPHIHVAFVPVVTSTGADGGEERRICAKDVLNRKHLKGWHGGITSLVQQSMGIENPGILNGRTKAQGGNRTVAQMKASDKAFERSRGKEIDRYRSKALKGLQRAREDAKRPSLTNLCLDAERRKDSQLLEPRRATWREKFTGR